MQKRQHVVAVHPLVLRGVDLQAVTEIEQTLGTRTLPHQRIERRQQGAGRHLARHFGLGQAVSRLFPALYLAHLQLAILDQFGQAIAAVGGVETEVIAQVLLGPHAQRSSTVQQQAAQGLSFSDRGLQDIAGNDPLRQIIEPLKPTATGHRDQACGKQPFQRMFLVAPVPPRAGAFLSGRQAAGPQCALLLDGLQHTLNRGLLLTPEARHLRINALALLGPLHAPAHQRVQRHRQQRRLMPPVFEQRAPPPLAPSGLFKYQRGVVAQTGKQRQVMGAHHGIDRINLQDAQALDHAVEVRSLDQCRRLAPGKTLGRQRHASSLLE